MVGYIRSGTTELFKFKKPLRIDVRGRKFVLLDLAGESDTVYFKPQVAESTAITVEGSNGKKYQVTKQGNRYTCSCPGFGFRRKCKHVDAIMEKL
jgi:hypothetical protein